jgi:DNA-binding CsgD family transcriptional regulator
MTGDETRARIRTLVNDGAATLQQIADALGIRMQTVAAHIKKMDDPAEIRAQMDENKRPRTLAAFGETKTVTAWARDPRSRVSRNTLTARLDTGVWAIEAALTTPRTHRGDAFGLNAGEAAALKAAADRLRSLPRVHRNTAADAPEMAATRELRGLIQQAAERASIAEIARAAGLSHEQTRYHLGRA